MLRDQGRVLIPCGTAIFVNRRAIQGGKLKEMCTSAFVCYVPQAVGLGPRGYSRARRFVYLRPRGRVLIVNYVKGEDCLGLLSITKPRPFLTFNF